VVQDFFRQMKVIINRKKWTRGKSSAWLYDKESDCFCAMGCLMNQAAEIPLADLDRQSYPGDALRKVFVRDRERATRGVLEFWEKYYQGKSTFIDVPIFHQIMKVNDDPFLTEDRREYKLKVLFKKIGEHLVIKDGD